MSARHASPDVLALHASVQSVHVYGAFNDVSGPFNDGDSRPDFRSDGSVSMSSLPRLLLIDDDPLLRRAMSRVLETSFLVTVAGSVGEALAVIEREPFDVVLCDLHLDGLSGLDLFVRLAKNDSPLATRLVITTGTDADDPALEHLRQSGVAILKKPVDHEATIALLRNVALRP